MSGGDRSRWCYTTWSGGGVRASALVGAYCELVARGLLGERGAAAHSGSSGGGVPAAALALGYAPSDVADMLIALDFERFRPAPPPTLRAALTALSTALGAGAAAGYNDGAEVARWLGDMVAASPLGDGDAGTTFAQLERRRRERGYPMPPDAQVPCLTLSGVRVTRRRGARLVYFAGGDMPIRDALRITISVPAYFAAPLHRGAPHVDGALLDNCPVRPFLGAPARRTVALVLGGDDEDVDEADIVTAEPDDPPLSAREMASAVARATSGDELTRVRVAAARAAGVDVVRVDAGTDVSFLDLSVTRASRAMLVLRGSAAAAHWLDKGGRNT